MPTKWNVLEEHVDQLSLTQERILVLDHIDQKKRMIGWNIYERNIDGIIPKEIVSPTDPLGLDQ